MIKKSEKEIMENWSGDIDKPVVSIECFTYNHCKYIEKALDGFLMQETNFPFEIVVHDDASSDGTTDILRSYKKEFPTIIRPIYEVENQYQKRDGSLQRIMDRQIRGEYVAHCEGDDYWICKDKLQLQFDYLNSHEECIMIFHAVYYENNGEFVGNDRITDEECDIPAERIIEGGGMYCATASIFCRTKYDKAYPKFREMADVGDYPLQIMLAANGKIHYIPKILGVYRECSNGSWTNKLKNDSELEISHWNNEILWLLEYDSYTEKRYHDSVMKRIMWCYCKLQELDDRKLVDLLKINSIKECLLKEDERLQSLKKELSNKDIIIFGNGYLGKRLCKWIIDNQINNLKGICDNRVSENSQEVNEYGVKLYSPETAVSKYPKAYFIIANLCCGEIMKKQLQETGVKENCIYIKNNAYFSQLS